MLPPTSFPFALEKEKNFSLYAWKKETSFPSLNQSCSISEVFKENGAGRFGGKEKLSYWGGKMAILNLQKHIFVVNKTPAQFQPKGHGPASSHGYSLFFGSEHRLHLAPFYSRTTKSPAWPGGKFPQYTVWRVNKGRAGKGGANW